MQLRHEKQTGLGAEIKLIPRWAWTLALLGFAVGATLFITIMRTQPDAIPGWGQVALGLTAGTMLGLYVLFVGYVNRDAARRGMSAAIWTLVAVVIPNGLGILLYFVLRQPRRKACPTCGNEVRTEFNFCPQCGTSFSVSCPQCQRSVGADDRYCPHCGVALKDPVVAAAASKPEGRSDEFV